MDKRNSRHNLANKEVHDSVMRVLKSKNFRPSEHTLVLKPNNQSEKNLQNNNLNSEKTLIPVAQVPVSVQPTQYTLHIPHIERAEFAKRFKVVQEDQFFIKTPEVTNQPNFRVKRRKYQSDPFDQEEEKSISSVSETWKMFLESGKLLATAGSIFAILFVGLNFSAFKQISDKYLQPNKLVEKQIALEGALEKNKMPKPNLLPTAGMKRENRQSFPDLNISVSPLENRIIIPKIGRNIPIVAIPNESLLSEDWKQLEKDIQEGLRQGVVHYPGTAVPGQTGNFFVTGHSSYYPWDNGKFKDVFALLHDLEVGDEYTVYWNQKKYNYIIREKKVVSPKDTTALDQPKNEKIATLMTCTPVGTAKNRLILVAEEND